MHLIHNHIQNGLYDRDLDLIFLFFLCFAFYLVLIHLFFYLLSRIMIFGLSTEIIAILQKMYERGKPLGELTESKRGAEVSKNFLRENDCGLETLIGQDMRKYCILWNSTYLPQTHKEYRRLRQFFDSDVIYLRRVDSMLEATISPGMHYGYNKNVYGIKKRVNCNYGLRYLLACMNSKVVDFYYKKKFSTKKTDAFPEIQTYDSVFDKCSAEIQSKHFHVIVFLVFFLFQVYHFRFFLYTEIEVKKRYENK